MRCEDCKIKKPFLLKCKFCSKKYCTFCIGIEKHRCVNADLCKKRKLDELENRLLTEQIKEKKIQKI
jgi:hypothetical protein|tara:strand:- start:21 stop:221 length:201 start_codon:yes stop_codon:yes gene_type:complete